MHLGGQRARAFLAEIRAVLVSGKGGREKREALRKWLADPDLVEQLMANQKAPWPSLRPE